VTAVDDTFPAQAVGPSRFGQVSTVVAVAGRWVRPGSRSTLLLVVALLGLAGAVGFRPGFTVDELAVLAQVEALAEGSWTVPHPYPEVDPNGTAFPDHLALAAGDAYAHYPKHPLVPAVFLAARSAIGPVGPWVVVLLGHVAAALAVSRVVRQVAPGVATTAFWLVGLGSPLVLHSLVLWLHGWGLALAAIATEAGVVANRRRGRGAVVPVMVAVGAVGALALLRTEGVLFGLALGGALGLEGLRRRDRLQVLGGAAVGVATLVVWRAEALWVSATVGELRSFADDAFAGGFLTGRISGTLVTFALGGYGTRAVVATVAIVLMLVAAWWARRGTRGPELWLLLAAGAGMHVLALHVPTASPVPGLVPALPLIFVGLVLPGRGRVDDDRFLVLVAVANSALVAATVYPAGSGADWAGRYALLALPALAGLVAPRLAGLGGRLERRDAVVVTALLLATSLAALPAVAGEVRRATATVAGVEAGLIAESARVAPAARTGLPVVVTDDNRLGRILAMHPDEVTALRADTGERLRALLVALRLDGVDEALFAVIEPPDATALAAIEAAGWDVGDPRALVRGSVRTLRAGR
jgi:hypothetical protein